jgi:N-acetylglucosamine-6-phosphate deacetylase
MTVAPEVHTREELVALVRWARVRDVRLSVGHSVATYEQARAAFDLGFSGVTHAWNAGRFHHREPGVLGAAVGRDDVHLMVIPDLVHCHRAAVEWLLRMHPPRRLVFVSDCAPIAGQPEGATSEFGSFQVQMRNGEARLMGASAGDLAGAGALLPAAVRRFKKASAWARAQKPLQWRRWCSENARRWLATR